MRFLGVWRLERTSSCEIKGRALKNFSFPKKVPVFAFMRDLETFLNVSDLLGE